jgi:hypothetical protein
MALTPEEQALKAELLLLSGELTVTSPEVLDWLERAVNIMGKGQLKSNERWSYNHATDRLIKEKVQ